jgi:aspartyl/asparaginyl-tRNA synthetase
MVKYASNLPRESVVDVEGVVAVPAAPVNGCSQSGIELKAATIRAISRAEPLPFDLADAARPDTEAAAAEGDAPAGPTVAIDTRLDARVVDLRVPAMQAIFALQAGVGRLFRTTMDGLGFQEIHSPCLIAGASEGGAACFRLDYCGRPACLAQSPQLYKQMALCGDFERVYEVTPVFRAEKSFTHRHLTEFTGLDFEMCINEHYDEVKMRRRERRRERERRRRDGERSESGHQAGARAHFLSQPLILHFFSSSFPPLSPSQVLDVIDTLFVSIFDGLNASHTKELGVIGAQYPFKPLRYLRKTLRLTFEEGIQILVDSGYPVPDTMADLNTEAERRLGALVAEKYDTDFFILTRFPAAIRPFYTMPDPANPSWSNSFDVFIRGEEIISGAQRIHDPAMLAASATAAGIPLDTIADYIGSFRYGAPPHGGAGVGLERVVMLFAGLDNIRKASLFPRDPKRLTP